MVTDANTQDVFQAVLCMDNESNSDDAKQLDMIRRYMKAMKFADPGGAIENVPADLSAQSGRHGIPFGRISRLCIATAISSWYPPLEIRLPPMKPVCSWHGI